MASLNVGNLGEYLREQRRNAQLSLRQLADAAGVSNPYLSQIERGLRKPSAEVLQQVAKALRISAETLYVRAGILDADRDRDEVETRAVLLADPSLNEQQKQVLLQIYESFRKENGFGTDAAERKQDGSEEPEPPAADVPAEDAQSTQRTQSAQSTRNSTTTRRTRNKSTAPETTAPRTADGSDADPQQTAS